MSLLGKISKRSLMKAGGKKKHIIVEIAKTRGETIAISGKIKEEKDRFAVFNCIMGLKPRREPLPQCG